MENYYHGLGKSCPPVRTNWRDGQEFDFVLADDGGIVEVVKRSYMSRWWFIKTPLAYYRITNKQLMDSDKKLHIKPSLVARVNPFEPSKIKSQHRLNKQQLNVIRNIVSGMTTEEAVQHSKKNKNYTSKQINSILKRYMDNPYFMEFMMESAINAAKSKGITLEWLYKEMKALYKKNETPAHVKRGLLKDMGESIGMYDTQPTLPPASGLSGFDSQDAELIDEVDDAQLPESTSTEHPPQ